MHDVVEEEPTGRRLYPYRCSRCGQCYCCAHRLVGYEAWICPDGTERPTTWDDGVTIADRRGR